MGCGNDGGGMAHEEEAGASTVQCGIGTEYDLIVTLDLYVKAVITFTCP